MAVLLEAHLPAGATLVQQPKMNRLVSTAAAIASFPIRGKTITIIVLHPLGIFIGIGDRGSWSRGPCNRRWHNFGIDGILLVHFFFVVRVAEDDDVAIVGWPEDVTVEVAKRSPGELLIMRGIRDETFLIRR
jgi:hypothetical protein